MRNDCRIHTRLSSVSPFSRHDDALTSIPSFSASASVLSRKLSACKPFCSNSSLSRPLTSRCRAMAGLPENADETQVTVKSEEERYQRIV